MIYAHVYDAAGRCDMSYVHRRKFCRTTGRARVRTFGTGLQPAHSLRPCWGGHEKGLDWVRRQTVSRLSRVGHEHCRVQKGWIF